MIRALQALALGALLPFAMVGIVLAALGICAAGLAVIAVERWRQ